MILALERFGFGRDSTLGVLSVDGVQSCFTIVKLIERLPGFKDLPDDGEGTP